MPSPRALTIGGILAAAALAAAAAQPEAPPPPSAASVEPDDSRSRAQRPDDPFTPSRHGFAFVNRFTGSSLPPEMRDAKDGVLLWARNVAETYADLPDEFGLCGGMSLSAADYYIAAVPIPDSNAPPEQGTPLYDAIYDRQRASLGPGAGYVLKFAAWMALPDIAHPRPEPGHDTQAEVHPHDDPTHNADVAPPPESTSALTRLELPAICQALERRELVPLGLVLTRAGRGRLWNNHQVLAYALKRLDDATLHISIYDPNYPADDGCIIRVEGIGVGLLGLDPVDDADTIAALRPGSPSTIGEMVRSTRIPTNAGPRAIRGIFPMPYEPATPPTLGAPDADSR